MILSFLLASLMSWFHPSPTPVNNNIPCSPRQIIRKCIDNLPRGFTFLKGYPINGRGGQKKKFEYSYLLSQNSKYLISLARQGNKNEGLQITLLDSRKRVVATSYVENKYYDAILFNCQRTGLYYIRFTYNPKKTSDFCSAAVLSRRF